MVAALVLAGFPPGFSPAMVASVGAAVVLITRTRDPHLVYEAVDWGLLVFFVGLFLIIADADDTSLTRHLLGFGERFNLQHLGVFTLATVILSNLVSNVPAVMLLKSLASQFANTHSAWLTLSTISLPVTLLTLLFGWLWLSWIR